MSRTVSTQGVTKRQPAPRWRQWGHALLSALLVASATASSAAAPTFTHFESGPVRPMAMSPDKHRLLVANTPNNTLDIFQVSARGLELITRLPVGLEPVSIAMRGNNEAWVVNHLSDSVSVVSLSGTPRVVRTLLVGDEPRDIVFAGVPERAFITTAHRGQHRTDPSIATVPGAGDPKLTTPGVGRADVWVFDPANLGSAMGGVPMRIMSFFADTPRALATSPDRRTVYVAAFKSGNQTTLAIPEQVCKDSLLPGLPCLGENGKWMPGADLGPRRNVEGKHAPHTGLMLKFDAPSGQWRDEFNRNWNNAVNFRLPDKDVFAVDAATLKETAAFSGVGTVLFNMIANPVSGNVYVTNTDSMNHLRYEGPGRLSGKTLQGNLARTQVTVIANGRVTPRHLNKHIDYTKLATSPSFDWSMRDHSLATPMEMAITRDGRKLFVAAYGSSKIGVFDTAQLESDTFNPRTASASYIEVGGGGPSGLVLDEERGLLFVTTRWDNSVKVVDLASRQTVHSVALRNPEPAQVTAGRPLLYDARRFSGNGEASCASCHIFGDKDELAWDLGNPDAKVTKSPIPGKLTQAAQLAAGIIQFGVTKPINGTGKVDDFHPMKGPMVTQTLRGMRNSGAMHWRGDKSTGPFGVSAFDSTVSFKNFAGAFKDLIGLHESMSGAGMQQFTDFQLPMMMPPNPVRRLDNSLTPSQTRARNFYMGPRPSVGIPTGRLIPLVLGETAMTCQGCHSLNPAKGQFGTGGFQSFEGDHVILKVPQLRNLYDRVGMFGTPKVHRASAPDSGFMGDQVRGFGFMHNGGSDTLFRFFTGRVFGPQVVSGWSIFDPDGQRRDMVDLMMAFDSDLAPIVGQQVTVHADNIHEAAPRIDLLLKRAATPFVSKELGGQVTECDLVAFAPLNGQVKGALFDPATKRFVLADGNIYSDADMRAYATIPGQEVTYTCAPPGSGKRLAHSF